MSELMNDGYMTHHSRILYSKQQFKASMAETSKKAKSKDHLQALKRRIELWASGELLDLLKTELHIK